MEIIIGIDPGMEWCGFASYVLATQQFGADTWQYHPMPLFDLLQSYQEHGADVLVRLEDTAQMQQPYEKRMMPVYEIVTQIKRCRTVGSILDVMPKLLGEFKILLRKMQNVGMNAGVSRLVFQWCEKWNLPVELVQPSSTSYSKLSAEEIVLLSGITEDAYPKLYPKLVQTSWDHCRDAIGLIVSSSYFKALPQVQMVLGTPGKGLDERQKRILAAIQKSCVTLQLQKNKRRRSMNR